MSSSSTHSISSITSSTTTDAGFAHQLRTSTASAHGSAEGVGFMSDLLRGRLDLAAYADLTAQHWFAYVELERAAESMRDDPVVGVFVADELTRVPSLERDLEHLLGPAWRSQVLANEATRAYCARLGEVGTTWPGGFLAHHYTRYLGDLSGGLHVGRVVARTFGLSGDGVRFYEFPAIPDPRDFKDHYRAQLDGAAFDDAERARILDEVLLAYTHNTRVLEALGEDHPARDLVEQP